MKKRFVIANWKMYVDSPDEATQFAKSLRLKMRGLTGVEVLIAAPYVFIPAVAEALKRSPIAVGAQATSGYTSDAHTGEVSATMLQASGAQFVIVGHSERRALGDTDEIVRKQILEVSAANLTAVLCVGERMRDHAGEHYTFIKQQLTSALINLPKKSLSKIMIAYEPVWAIGKDAADAMKPQEVQETVIFIKKTISQIIERTAALKVPILYGGSVEESNAAALLHEGGINGFLVGHASSKLETFLPILKACR